MPLIADLDIMTTIWRRWRRGYKYRAGANQVVPGFGEDDGSEDERRQPALGARRPTWPEKYTAAASGELSQRDPPPNTTILVGEAKHTLPSEEAGGNVALTIGSVQSASLRQVAVWASTRDVILLILAAGCQQQGQHNCHTSETQGGTAETTEATCAVARRTACALLTRVFGNGTIAGEYSRGQQAPGIGEKEASLVLDRWYEGFCSTTAPPQGRGGGGGGAREGSSLPLLREEPPRLLLEAMLKIPAVKTGFVKRGLTRHLVDVLRVASAEVKIREAEGYHHSPNIGYPRGGDAFSSSCGSNKVPKHDHGVPQSCPMTNGGDLGARKHDASDQSTSPLKNYHQWLPWWLLFSQGGVERGGGRDRNFEGEVKLGEKTDGGGGTELALRTCGTNFGEIVAAEVAKEERGLGTSRDNGSTADGSCDDAAGNGLNDWAGETTVSAIAKPQEYRERDGVADRSATAECSTSSTTRGRVAPPMLRLDALDSGLDAKEGAAPHLCSSHTAVTLSAASTRVASEHLVRASVHFSAHVPRVSSLFCKLCIRSLLRTISL